VRPDVLELAAELSRRGEPFALATVVWRRAPSSGAPGSTALVTTDGKVRGWMGGACAEPTVVREALRALREGVPRLLFLGPPEELAGRDRDGAVAVPIACQSEGAMEVYVEPVLPQPLLVVIGRSPAVRTLAALGTALGWRTAVVDDGGDPDDYPEAGRVLTSLDLDPLGIDERSFVVVATQGHYDEEALERALATPAAYVGLVASRRRAEGVLGYLRDRGLPEERLARVRAPAGLDLGPVAHDEIAVAVLAELVRERASRTASPTGRPGLAPGEASPTGRPGLAPGLAGDEPRPTGRDPVCGMVVDVGTARYRTVHAGRTYHLCSAGCLRRFEEDPARFLAPRG
jgi:xanthine dehydrogenase accessory factor